MDINNTSYYTPEYWWAKRRNFKEILKQLQDDGGLRTATSIEQAEAEGTVLKFYESCKEKQPVLLKSKHVQFLKKAVFNLNENYECLDSSRPWLCFWILHSLELLNERLEDEENTKIINFLIKCQLPTGGFGGGPGQYAHLASTYAAVNALCTIGTKQAYDIIDRENLKRFLSSLHGEDGSFCMHENGESDLRGAYCALAIAKLTGVYELNMFQGTAEWIARCQTWEGGFGGCPGMEAHGGYAYCALAALLMLERTELCRSSELLRWIVNKQMRLEGGFQGRTNKLVDGCYSFWQGGTFPLINIMLTTEGKVFKSEHWLFNQEALQEYILICCQNPHGGLVDKPGKDRDIYHTCYVLSGLSIAQNSQSKLILGKKTDRLNPINPLYNVEISAACKALDYFSALPTPMD